MSNYTRDQEKVYVKKDKIIYIRVPIYRKFSVSIIILDKNKTVTDKNKLYTKTYKVQIVYILIFIYIFLPYLYINMYIY